jgi:hypothetical protein
VDGRDVHLIVKRIRDATDPVAIEDHVTPRGVQIIEHGRWIGNVLRNGARSSQLPAVSDFRTGVFFAMES